MYSKIQKFETLAWEESEGQHEKEVWEEVYLPERATSSLPGGNQQRRMLIAFSCRGATVHFIHLLENRNS